MKNKSPIVIALDFAKLKELEAFVEKLDPNDCRLKIGKQAFTLFGPELVKKLVQQNFDVFLDLKFHDIPNTVAEACKASADLGVWMLNVHASGGTKMMSAAREALVDKSSPLLIAVTVLTSMSNADLDEQNIQSDCQEQALHLAGLTQKSGLDGVVCSSLEAPILKNTFGKQFKLITPGIRPKGDKKGDQQRVMTPEQALANGSDYLVIGRPITQADDPVGKLLTINSEIGWAKK